MQPIARHATRRVIAKISGSVLRKGITQWTCAECRFKTQNRGYRTSVNAAATFTARRAFGSSLRLSQDAGNEHKRPIDPVREAASAATSSHPPESHSQTLPSHVEQQRWQMSKDTTKFVDGVLARASIASQHINVYMGTDYSGIETLRNNILEQERAVKTRHTAVDKAKTEHQEAFTRQAAAQKEIVGLLERKSSWSPTDLERYMSLVRSEHINDQTVQAAKDSLAAAERELEDARSLLERLERKQYHEEQIWSDTIRRNSTWVTFGLMGVNIVLLLAQILIFEPYRRRKIVSDVKSALDEKTMHAPAAEVERRVDEVVEPISMPTKVLEAGAESVKAPQQPMDALIAEKEESAQTTLVAGEVLPEEAIDAPGTIAAAVSEDTQPPQELSSWEAYQQAWLDLFSERLIQIKQVELTTVALQGAATGVAAMGMLFLLLRPK